MRQVLKDIPSRYLAYPEGTQISIRPLKFGEVLEFTERYGDPINYYNYLAGLDVVEGIDFWEITTGDWQYIELSIISISYATPSFTIPGPPCDKCSTSDKSKDDSEDKSQTIVASLPMSKKKLQLPKEYTAQLIPTDLIFNTVDDEVNAAVSVDLESGKSVTLDFFRLKHYIHMLKNNLTGNAQEIVQITGLDLNEIEYEDFPYLETAYGMLSHGLDDKVNLKCPSCGDTKEMEVDWGASSLIPFRPSSDVIRNRIHVGQTSKSANSGDEKTSVSSSESSLRPVDRGH